MRRRTILQSTRLLFAVFCVCSKPSIAHPVDIELNIRAYEELKLANEATLSREKNFENRQRTAATNASYSSDIQAVFSNLLQTVLNTRNSSTSLKLAKTPYPILIVLVDFTDEGFEWAEETHRAMTFGEGKTVKEFWDKNFHGAAEITAAETTSGATDGIITVHFDGPHPNLPDNYEMGLWIAANLGTLISKNIDAIALDADFNGWLTRDELSIHFVLAGSREKGGGFAVPFNISSIEGNALVINGINVHGFGVAAEQKLGSSWSDEAKKGGLRSTLIHEFGHLFGATDKYLLAENSDGEPGSLSPFGDWSVMDSPTYYSSDNLTYAPNAMALDKFETGVLESAEISSDGQVSLSPIAEALAPLGRLREAKRGLARPL